VTARQRNKDGSFRFWTGVFDWLRLQLFDSQLQLFDLLCELLRLRPNCMRRSRAISSFQMLDFEFSREQSLMLSDDDAFSASRVNVFRSGSVAVIFPKG
jgi:hypothetical protein